MFGETFSLNPMFTFFAVQTQLHFSTAANYENNLPPNVGLRPDGGLCILSGLFHNIGLTTDSN